MPGPWRIPCGRVVDPRRELPTKRLGGHFSQRQRENSFPISLRLGGFLPHLSVSGLER